MKMFQKITTGITAASTLVISALPVLAAPPTLEEAGLSGTVNAKSAGFVIDNFSRLLQGLLNMVLFIAALLVFAYLIWGGVQWITSGGDKGKTEEARNKITAAVIGLAVVAASYAIFKLILYVVGISDPFAGVNPNIQFYTP